MAEITNITNPSPHKFDPLGELIALVPPTRVANQRVGERVVRRGKPTAQSECPLSAQLGPLHLQEPTFPINGSLGPMARTVADMEFTFETCSCGSHGELPQ